MQAHAPEAFDLSKEASRRKSSMVSTSHPRNPLPPVSHGPSSARTCVRFVQVWSGAGGPTKNWTTTATSKRNCLDGAGYRSAHRRLLHDLKTTGLLKDTLVVWTTELVGCLSARAVPGATIMAARSLPGWSAPVSTGHQLRPKRSVGLESPDPNYYTRSACDHSASHGYRPRTLTFRFSGANRRLTDVHGKSSTIF